MRMGVRACIWGADAFNRLYFRLGGVVDQCIWETVSELENGGGGPFCNLQQYPGNGFVGVYSLL